MGDKVFDFKKEYKDLYIPKDKPVLIQIPEMNFIMVDGSGDPNNNIEFETAVELLYGLSYTIKMSKMKGNQPEGYFEYIVPPLEGLWWVDDGVFSLEKRDNWKWSVMIRQPAFVKEETFIRACEEFKRKKPDSDLGRAYLKAFEEGMCVQIMHIGPYSTEPETMKKVESFMLENELSDMVSKGGKHHEIYLSDPRKANPESMKTVLRHPVAHT